MIFNVFLILIWAADKICLSYRNRRLGTKKQKFTLLGGWKCIIFEPINCNFSCYTAGLLQDCFFKKQFQLYTAKNTQSLSTSCNKACFKLFQQVVIRLQMKNCNKPDCNRLVATWWNCYNLSDKLQQAANITFDLLTSFHWSNLEQVCRVKHSSRQVAVLQTMRQDSCSFQPLKKQFSFSRINELCLGNGIWTWCRRQQETANVDRSLSV